MKKILRLMAVICYGFYPGVFAMDIVKDGAASAVIVTADDAGQCQRWAAEQLRNYIQRATGAKLEILPESKAPGGRPLISVGHTALAAKAGLKTDDLKYDGCKLLAKDNVLYLLGNDYIPPNGVKADNNPNPGNGEPQGTIRAVTTFLEDVVAVRWYLPGPEGEFVPSLRGLSAPDTLNKTFIPQMAVCVTGYDTPIARYANNGRSTMRVLFHGGHSWPVHVSPKEYADSHPEYFIMDMTGKRDSRKSHLCTSNPEVRKIMLEKFRNSFDKGYDIIELGASDGWDPCLCPECQKKYGDGGIPFSAERPAERVWELNKWLMDELAKSHPGKYVMPIIYGPTRFPSKLFDKIPGNVVLEFSGSPDDEIWRGKFKSCMMYDIYIWEADCVGSCFIPAVDPAWLQKRMRLFRSCGVNGLYGGGRGTCWGLGGPAFYAYAKLAGDPDFNIDRMLTEYCGAVYGEAGPAMERFFKLFHSRSGKTLLENLCADRLTFENGYPAEDTFCALYPPDVAERLDRLLRKAESAVKNERAKGWLKHTRDEFDGLKTIAEMFAAKRAFELAPSKPSLMLVKDKVNAVESWRERILSYYKDPEYLKRWFPRYIYLCNDLISDGIHAKYDPYYYNTKKIEREVEEILKGERTVRGHGIGSSLGHHEILEPITWDFERMTESVGRPAEEKKIIAVRMAGSPGPDGMPSDSEWLKAPPAPFLRYKAPNTKPDDRVSSSVRLLYNDGNLFVRYECGEPSLDTIKLASLPKDGNVWGLDEVELFLNPECSGRKFMHFMAAPVKNAMYDERKGYIDDQLDPRYSEPDIEWNADWTYKFNVDQANKRWTLDMAIPFKSLGVATPAEGTAWTANFARCRRAGGIEELSCWIPDGFGNPEVFGALIFGAESGGSLPVEKK